MSGRAARDVNLKQVFFSCQTFLFFFVFFTSDKANSMLAVDFCTCLFIKQPKYAERFRSPESSWAEPPQHLLLSFLEWPREVHGVFFLHYSQLICFDCTDNLYPIPSKSCHQLQLMGSAVSNLKFLYAEHRMSKAPGKKAHFRLSMSFKSSLVAASLACIIFNRARLNASDTEGEENDAHVILDYMHT